MAGLDLQEHARAIRLSGDAKSVAHEQRATSNPLGECLALDQFHAGDWQQVREFVSKGFGLAVEEYEKDSSVGYTVTARLEQMLTTSSLAIIVMSPEDEQKDQSFRVRQNIVHEIGLFQGRLGFEKVFRCVTEAATNFFIPAVSTRFSTTPATGLTHSRKSVA